MQALRLVKPVFHPCGVVTPRTGKHKRPPLDAAGANHPAVAATKGAVYLTWFETSLVISNMLTVALPLNTALRAASALMLRLFFLS